MVSRRNIRVKVMQLLYAIDTINEEGGIKDPVRELKKHFDKSESLLIYLIYFLTQLLQYVETNAKLRASKNITTTEDLNVNIKLAGNDWLWKVLDNATYQKLVASKKLALLLNNDVLRKLFLLLEQTPEYNQYIKIQARTKDQEREIISFIFNSFLLPNADFTSHIEDLFDNWEDDCEMMQLLINNYIQRPATKYFDEYISDEKWLFSKLLLTTVLEKSTHLSNFIEPKLKNWDMERIPALDLIILKMAISEFLFFETIPTKVTINEYIDLAKEYSTPQSGQFVNGLLDNIHKELTVSGQLQKVIFKGKEN